MAGVFYAVRLWATAYKYARADGVFEGVLGRDELEEYLRWDGKPGDLIAALVTARLLETSPLRVHEWHPHQPRATEVTELGERQTERAEARADARRARGGLMVPVDKSQYFIDFWRMIPMGKRHGINPAYESWVRQGLDDPGAAGDEKRAEVYRTFAAQLSHDHWRAAFINGNKNAALSYVRQADWLHWSVKQPTAPSAAPSAAMAAPAQRDEADLRRDWQAIAGNDAREWPGYEQAMAEVMARGRN